MNYRQYNNETDFINHLEFSNSIFSSFHDPQASIGSETVYKGQLGNKIIYTENVKNFFYKYDCHWLKDIIFSYFNKYDQLDMERLHCNLLNNNDNSAMFSVTDPYTNKPLITQYIPYSDIKLNIKLRLDGDNTQRLISLINEG